MSKSLLNSNPGCVCLAFALTAGDASAQDRIRWKMPSAFASTLARLGPSGVRLLEGHRAHVRGQVE